MLNWIQIGFLSLTVIYSPLLYFVYKYETFVPAFVLRAVKYGAFTYKGQSAKFMKKLDVPKYYYRHFYAFACILNSLSWVYMVLVYFYDFKINEYYIKYLQTLYGVEPPVPVLASIATLSLLTLQCVKRVYETHCMQVFAKSSKMYTTHYIAGLLYFLTVNAGIVGSAPLFCGDKNRDAIVWTDLRTIIALIPGIPIFLWAWYEQHQSNIILANLRKNKGQVVTEEHKVPHGRLFESISSPHRFCEIIIYAVLSCIIQTRTFFCFFVWVLCNQTLTSILVHKWYKITFRNYPSGRYAIFKGII